MAVITKYLSCIMDVLEFVHYINCSTSQYIIEVLGCIERCIVLYSQMYWDVFSEHE